MEQKSNIVENLEANTKKLTLIRGLVNVSNGDKYALLFVILKDIASLLGKTIELVTDFTNVKQDDIIANISQITTIFENNANKITELFEEELKFTHRDDHKKVITLLRKMTRQINCRLAKTRNVIKIVYCG